MNGYSRRGEPGAGHVAWRDAGRTRKSNGLRVTDASGLSSHEHAHGIIERGDGTSRGELASEQRTTRTRTMLDALDGLADSHSVIRYTDRHGITDEITYAEWVAEVDAFADRIGRFGAGPGERVLVVTDDQRSFMVAFAGCLVAGVVPTAVPSPMLGQRDVIDRRVGDTGASLVIGGRGRPSRRGSTGIVATAEIVAATPLPRRRRSRPDDVAYVQLSSGSTGRPAIVEVTHAQLAANLAAVHARLELTPDDVLGTWLPFHHDMGLVGCFLAPLWGFIGTSYLPPTAFMRRPLTWIELLSSTRASLTYAPNFAYQMVADAAAAAAGPWDLSELRVAGCGGEHINPTTAASFIEAFAAHGLRPEALKPSYGMAEAVVGVSIAEKGVRLVDLGGAAAISCGRPLDNLTVTIVDRGGSQLPDGQVGEIVVSGPSVTGSGTHRTGDLGLIDEGEIVICGRTKNLAIVNGRNIQLEAIEQVAVSCGANSMSVAAFSVDGGPTEQVVVALDWRACAAAGELAGRIRTAVAARFGITPAVVTLPRGAFLRTSSGKPRRQAMRDAYRRTRPTTGSDQARSDHR